ncbi:MAG: D-alanyl-D-alanine carboxypeptidase [Clostridia bacterium]|nr:D-alanyl-D-alanine carboxypeptidase [Clostridia bacterium]
MKGKKTAVLILLAAFLVIMPVFSCAAKETEENYAPSKTFNGKTLCEYLNIENIPAIEGYSSYVFNIETGSVIYEKNANDKVYPASTVKLMTAIVAYENIPDLQTEITASASALSGVSGSNIGIKTGETLTAEQLISAVLLVGANDASNVLAEYVSGDIKDFCALMNEKALEIGAENTYFTNPTGLHNEEMVTTAYDMAVISGYFYRTGTLFEISDTTKITIPATEKTPVQRTLINRNYLISRMKSDKFYYSPARGMSLGGTPEAGECIITSATDRSGLTYICVVMNAPSSDKTNFACTDAISLLKMCLDNFNYASVVSTKNAVCEIPVKLAVDTDYITLVPSGELKALLPKDLEYMKNITIEPRISENFAVAPVYEGQKFGEAIVKYNNEIILGTIELVAGKNIDKSNFLYFLNRAETFVKGKWFKAFAVFALILFAVYFIASVSFSKKKNRRRYYKK